MVEKSGLAKGKLAALDGDPTMVLKKEVHRETVEEIIFIISRGLPRRAIKTPKISDDELVQVLDVGREHDSTQCRMRCSWNFA